MYRRVLLTAVYTLFLCGASAHEDQIEKQLTAAKEEFEKATEKARAGLLSDLKKRQQAAQKAGDLKMFEKVQAEVEAFEADLTLPKLVPVRGYEIQLRTARARLEDSYRAAVKQYTMDGEIALAKGVQEEFDEFVKGGGVVVDGRKRWVHAKGEFTLIKAGEWEEKSPNGKTYRFKELSRTKEYVELGALNGNTMLRYRIFDDRADVGKKTESNFTTMFSKGKWVR